MYKEMIYSQCRKVSQEKNQLVVNLIFLKEFPFFDGHFKDQPVLPAFMILESSKVIIEKYITQKNIEIKSIHRTKFLQIILPEQKLEVSVHSEPGGNYNVTWKREDQIVAKLQFQAI